MSQRFLLLLLLPLLAGCGGSKSTTTTTEVHEKIIGYDAGPCFGSCPVFSISIFNDGTAVYTGKQFAKKQGTYSLNLSTEELNSWKELLAKTQLEQFPDVLENQIQDAAYSTFFFKGSKDGKTVRGSAKLPEQLSELKQQFWDFKDDSRWKLSEKPDFDLPESYIPNQFIVQLKQGAEAEKWVANYQKQAMKIVKVISPPTRMWLVEYDPFVYAPKEMLKVLQADPDVEQAEFNKELTQRK
jgi:hypothetical protein